MPEEKFTCLKPWPPEAFVAGQAYTRRSGALLATEDCVRRDDERKCFVFQELNRPVRPERLERPEDRHPAQN